MSTTVYRPTDHTPAEWEAMAQDCVRREQESWDRSDTDGFLSQWASQSMASRYRSLAQLSAEGGVTTFTGVVSVEDPTTLLDARQVETRYGYSWAISTEGYGTVWFNDSNARKGERRMANDTGKGYLLASFDAPAVMLSNGHVVPARDGERSNVRVSESYGYDH